MAAFPAFLFYAEDFATGTAAMSPMEVGIYIRCLCHQWSHGFVPDDQRQIARLSGAMLDEIANAWPNVQKKFVESAPGQLQNARLEQVREELLDTHERRAKAGKRGATKRWGKKRRHSPANGPATSRGYSKTMASRVEDEDDNEDDNESGNETESKPSLKEKVGAVVSHYQTYHPRARAGSKERSKIAERLRDGSSVDDLKLAIDGCHKSPFHCGDNERGAKYQSLELIFRDASKVSQFIEFASGERGPPTQSAIAAAGDSYLARRLGT
jgi:uncharacterized protein YdaU (DUF1376 family)